MPGSGEIYVIGIDGEGLTNLTTTPGSSDIRPTGRRNRTRPQGEERPGCSSPACRAPFFDSFRPKMSSSNYVLDPSG